MMADMSEISPSNGFIKRDHANVFYGPPPKTAVMKQFPPYFHLLNIQLPKVKLFKDIMGMCFSQF